MDELAGRGLQQARLGEIHRRWPRYGWDYLGRARWDSWSAEPFLGLGITGALIAALYFEFTLLTSKEESWFAALSDLGLHPTGQVAILLLTGVNAWTMDRWLASRTHGNRSISAWLRLRRLLTAGVPVFGLASVPTWRWIAESAPLGPFTAPFPEQSAIVCCAAALAGIALTSALPVGGLFIPFWICAHHHLWPGMVRSLPAVEL